MRVSVASVCGVVCLLAIAAVPAQEREDRALLPWEQMQSIINEASGDRAMHHVLELVPYPRVRPLSEYTGNFRESEVMARFARDYGYSDVRIESFPTANRLWQPTVGELWMVEPQLKKIYDIHDVAVSLAANSAPGDVTAELVDVGTASDALARRQGSQRQDRPRVERRCSAAAGAAARRSRHPGHGRAAAR